MDLAPLRLLVLDRVERVADEVQDDLLDPRGIELRGRAAGVRSEVEQDLPLLGLGLEERHRLRGRLVQVGRDDDERRRARVREEVGQEPGEASRLQPGRLRQLRRGRGAGGLPLELLLEQLQVQAHGVQRVPDLVGEARRDLPQLGAPLGFDLRRLDASRPRVEDPDGRRRRADAEQRDDRGGEGPEVELVPELLDALGQLLRETPKLQDREVADGHLDVVRVRSGLSTSSATTDRPARRGRASARSPDRRRRRAASGTVSVPPYE